MRIGQAAKLSGLNERTIRYYEKERILRAPERRASGYRDYDLEDIERMQFLRRVRSFGFSLNDCREFLALLGDVDRQAGQVKALAGAHLNKLEAQRRELDILCADLSEMVDACSGGSSSKCAILDRFSAREA